MKSVERPTPRAMGAHVAVAPCHNILVISASFLVFAISLVFAGCGFTTNSTAGSSPGQSAGTAGGSSGDNGPPGGQTIPVPGALQALTGCTNPNTGVSNGDWGVGTDPVYTFVDNQTPVVGEPKYSSNAIFWISREDGPGQSILMTGAFTKGPKTARLALIPAGTIDWETLVRGSSTVISTTQQGTTGLSFI